MTSGRPITVATPGCVISVHSDVAAAAISRGPVGAAAVAVFHVPVVGASLRVRILNFVDHAALAVPVQRELWGGGSALPLPSLNQITSACPNMMWLAPVPPFTDWWKLSLIAVGVGKVFEVGNVAILHVIEAHGRWSLRPWSLAEGEYSVLKFEGCARPLVPVPTVISTQGNSVRVASGGIVSGGIRSVAIELLPHLIEAVHRAGRIGVVEEVAVGQLKRPELAE